MAPTRTIQTAGILFHIGNLALHFNPLIYFQLCFSPSPAEYRSHYRCRTSRSRRRAAPAPAPATRTGAPSRCCRPLVAGDGTIITGEQAGGWWKLGETLSSGMT